MSNSVLKGLMQVNKYSRGAGNVNGMPKTISVYQNVMGLCIINKLKLLKIGLINSLNCDEFIALKMFIFQNTFTS